MTYSPAPARHYYGLDILRATLMIIGVFWHSVEVLSPFGGFVYSSEIHRSWLLRAIVYPEHIFRMEAFFLVSGFFAMMVRTRKGKPAFWQARIKRVLVPVLLGCFGVNLGLQIFGSIFMNYQWSHFDMWRWVMHGWFLITLFTCAVIDMLLPMNAYQRASRLGIVFMVVIAVFGYVALQIGNVYYWHCYGPISGNLFNFFIVNTVQYFPFYYGGGLLYVHCERLEHLSRRFWFFLIAVTLLSATLEYCNNMRIVRIFLSDNWLWTSLTYRLNHVCAAGGIAFLLFYWCYRSTYQGGKTLKYLIDSAIVVYLVHHPLVIIYGWLFDSPQLSNGAYYALLVVITLISCYIAYEIIRRHAALRFAFGLKTAPKPVSP